MRGREGGYFEQRELIFLALARCSAAPVYLSLAWVSQTTVEPLLWILMAGAVPYGAATLWLATSRHWQRINPWAYVAADLGILSAALIIEGGPEAQVQIVFFFWAIAMALVFGPRDVLLCAVCAMGAYALASLPFILDSSVTRGEDLRSLLRAELILAWIAVITFGISTSFDRRSRLAAGLSLGRQRLLADALSAEDRARRRLSQTLHDDTLQVLLAVGQDLSAGLHGDTRLLVRAREELRLAIRELRETVRGLHPTALAHGGLAGGLDVVSERAGRYGDFEVDLRVDPAAAGWHDSLVVSLVREIATNAAKHSEADHLAITVTCTEDWIVVEVVDDGRGMEEHARDRALAGGHIGLASCAERIDASGGTFELASAPGRGTRVRFELPLPRGTIPAGNGTTTGGGGATRAPNGQPPDARERPAAGV